MRFEFIYSWGAVFEVTFVESYLLKREEHALKTSARTRRKLKVCTKAINSIFLSFNIFFYICVNKTLAYTQFYFKRFNGFHFPTGV